MKNIYIIISVIVAVLLLWFANCGNIKNIRPQNEAQSLSPREEDARRATSLFADEMHIVSEGTATETNPKLEYITLQASINNKNSVMISGWMLKGADGKSATIKNASKLPISGKINTESPLYIAPGEIVFIVTGRSPIGVSFQENICSGYSEQFQDITPETDKKCPSNISYQEDFDTTFQQVCLNYVSSLPRCAAHIGNLPNDLSQNCKNYIQNKLNYNSCVETHKLKDGFYRPRWRIFLGLDEEMWGSDTGLIRLYDETGKLVDSQLY